MGTWTKFNRTLDKLLGAMKNQRYDISSQRKADHAALDLLYLLLERRACAVLSYSWEEKYLRVMFYNVKYGGRNQSVFPGSLHHSVLQMAAGKEFAKWLKQATNAT